MLGPRPILSDNLLDAASGFLGVFTIARHPIRSVQANCPGQNQILVIGARVILLHVCCSPRTRHWGNRAV
jgi:hypothetical protein